MNSSRSSFNKEYIGREMLSFMDLPDELICLIAIFLPRVDVLRFFLIQKGIEPICIRHGFYETRMRNLGVSFDRRTQDFKKLYIKTIQRLGRISYVNLRFRVLKNILNDTSGYSDRKFAWKSSKQVHLDVRVDEVQMLENTKKECETIVIHPKLIKMDRFDGMEPTKRVREMSFKFRISNFQGSYLTRFGFMETKVYAYRTNESCAKNWSLKDLGLAKIDESDDLEVILKVHDGIGLIVQSCLLYIHGKDGGKKEVNLLKGERWGYFDTFNATIYFFFKLSSPGEKFTFINHKIMGLPRFELGRVISNVRRVFNLEDFMGEYEEGRKLGTGTCFESEAWKVKKRGSGTIFARKRVELLDSTSTDPEKIGEDLRISQMSRHENIVSQESFFYQNDGDLYIILEYMNCGSIRKIKRTVERFPERVISQCMRQVLKGLDFLHDTLGLVHRSITPQAIMVNDRGICKISEFGLSGWKTPSQYVNRYMCACTFGMEAHLEHKKMCSACDIWSVGVVAAEMFVGNFPFNHGRVRRGMDLHGECEIIQRNVASKKNILSDSRFAGKGGSNNKNSKDFMDFLYKCLCRMDERWSAKELLDHPFITKHIDEKPSFRSWLHRQFIKVKKEEMKAKRTKKLKKN